MKNKFKLLGIIALGALICFSFVGCDNSSGSRGSRGSRGPTYTWGGSGLTSAEWSSFGLPAPASVINTSFSVAERNQILAEVQNDNESLTGSKDSASDIMVAVVNFYGVSYADAVINKLKAQGWVVAATTNSLDPTDFADIFIAIRE